MILSTLVKLSSKGFEGTSQGREKEKDHVYGTLVFILGHQDNEKQSNLFKNFWNVFLTHWPIVLKLKGTILMCILIKDIIKHKINL